MNLEEGQSLQAMSTGVAMEFLQTQLDAIEDRLSDRTAYLSQTYREGETLPRGEQEMTATLLQQKALIYQLMRECQVQQCEQILYPEVLRQRLGKAEQRLSELDRHAMSTEGYRSQHWQLWVEKEILAQLLGR